MNENQIEIEKREEAGSENKSEPKRSYTPRVDIFEINEDVYISADMPGVDDKSVDVTVERNVLTITGRVLRKDLEGYENFYSESPGVKYERTFTLSDQIDSQGIQASVRNGVLTLVLPKVEEAKSRKIAVQVGG